MLKQDYILTVICLVYNHEEYLKECLDGFVNQKTKYKYKVVMHDDASTDLSREIIDDYSQKYPDIIFPYYEKENMWQKGIYFLNNLNSSIVDTKYVALCEGDDFWDDERKLEKQISFLEENPGYSGVTHNTKIIDDNGFGQGVQCDWNLSRDICGLSPTLFFPHTSSYVFVNPWLSHSSIIKKQIPFLKWDKNFAIYMLSTGKVYFLKDFMSVYRHVTNKGTSTEYMEKQNNMTLQKISMEYDLYNHLKAVDMLGMSSDYYCNHYYRNIFVYSMRKFAQNPSLDNMKIVCIGIIKSPYNFCSFVKFACIKIKERLKKRNEKTIGNSSTPG